MNKSKTLTPLLFYALIKNKNKTNFLSTSSSLSDPSSAHLFTFQCTQSYVNKIIYVFT